MKNFAAVLAALILTATAEGSARADTAVGVEFGYPGQRRDSPAAFQSPAGQRRVELELHPRHHR